MSTIAKKSSLVFYGIGSISPAITGNLLGAPIFFYYNNVLGLEAWLVSLALALALVIDGITDPCWVMRQTILDLDLAAGIRIFTPAFCPGLSATFFLSWLTLDLVRLPCFSNCWY